MEGLVATERAERHLRLCEWMLTRSNEALSRRTIVPLLDDLTPGAWYKVMSFVDYALQRNEDNDEPVLRSAGGYWHYVAPSASGSTRDRAS